LSLQTREGEKTRKGRRERNLRAEREREKVQRENPNRGKMEFSKNPTARERGPQGNSALSLNFQTRGRPRERGGSGYEKGSKGNKQSHARATATKKKKASFSCKEKKRLRIGQTDAFAVGKAGRIFWGEKEGRNPAAGKGH